MASKDFDTVFGKVNVRNAVFEHPNGTDMYEGIQIKVEDNGGILEVGGWRDVEEMTKDEVEEFIEDSLFF